MSIRAFAATAAALALAAQAGAQSRPRPDDPAVKTAPAAHASAYESYRPFREEEPAPWREVNDEVGRLGGHSGHMGKDAVPAPAAQPPSGPTAQPAARSGNPGGSKHGH
jgi:hypothetical protein